MHDKPGVLTIAFTEQGANPLLDTLIHSAQDAGYVILEENMYSAVLTKGYNGKA